MRIPEVQYRMRAMADTIDDPDCPSPIARELRILADELSRRPQKKGKRTSDPMSDEKRMLIKEMSKSGFPQLAIAHKLNICAARVSETLKGLRV